MEERISELDGVEDCVLVFETKQLRVTGENPDALLPQIREICSGIESEAKVIAPAPRHYGKNGQRVYTLENLGCAHCAAKMQHQISQLDGIDDCVLVYETRQLRVKGENPDALLPQIREICSNIESEVKVIAPEQEQEDEKQSHPLAEMLVGAGLFAAGLAVPNIAVKLVLLIAAYLLLGRHVLLTAIKNIGRGQVFDENFLMAVATIGAWAVGSFDEAVGVMLFYRVGEYFEDRRRRPLAQTDHGCHRPASGDRKPCRGGRKHFGHPGRGRSGGRHRARPSGRPRAARRRGERGRDPSGYLGCHRRAGPAA